MSDHPVMSPPLAARLAELKECGMDLQVVIAKPDYLTVLVRNGDPDPFLVTISIDSLPKITH
ncbi:hypothetical protein SAMN05216189_10478 [Pseudomonas delhiensis]|uniref:Uncharacterized protein n=1 Tax=Pseudomonas delhiensis TaxID=366289 RepID=A0A239NC62_9PSED|nr:hypothetical protein [Pseudomonas delhiensis]SDK67749.1 hypothetical protein SAMN05216189_10478 [Pseudomonas delhiensis]SNT52557.1 hypothetical protein SAMN06295949_1428 [Pseudomonas delhiensis]